MNKLPALLDQFIREQIRKKVREQKLTSLQKRKFYTTCLMLAYTRSNFPLKAIAEEAKVSEKVLRVWRTEPNFKGKVNALATQYAHEFVAALEKSEDPAADPIKTLVKEFPRYSRELSVAVTSLLVERMKERALDINSERNREFIALGAFAAFLWQHKVDKLVSKKERLDSHKTWHEVMMIDFDLTGDVFKGAERAKDFQLARELFDQALNALKGRQEKLYQLERMCIEHNWRES